MVQFKAIPQPTDQRNVSQNDILNNMGYLITNPALAQAGILPVDHLATGDNALSPKDGFHNQVSYLAQSQPANLTNAVNGQNSNGIGYVKLDNNSKPQLNHFNNDAISNVSNGNAAVVAGNYQITPCLPLRCAVSFDGTLAGPLLPAACNSAFNVLNVTNVANVYTINFQVNLPSVNYIVLGIAGRNDGSKLSMTVVPNSTLASPYLVSSFTFFVSNGTSVSNAAKYINIMIFGG